MRRPGFLGDTDYWFNKETPSVILYNNPVAKLLRPLISKSMSRIAGSYYDTKASTQYIKPFIAKHGIRMNDFNPSDPSKYTSFNEFFARKLAPDARSLGSGFISPADSRVLVVPKLDVETKFWVKNSKFKIRDLLKDDALAQKYLGGVLLVFRLKPEDYHRFHFPVNGFAHPTKKIPGKYHAVYKKAYERGFSPLAENKRHLITLQTSNVGLVSIVPTGALGVSRIVETYKPNSSVMKGDEIGFFQWGGSVVSILVEPNKLVIRPDILKNSAKGLETYVETGEQIAKIM